MTSPRIELPHAQTALANACDALGLTEHAAHLRTAFCQNSLVECRTRCEIIKHNAGLIHAVIAYERTTLPVGVIATDLLLGSMASRALELEAQAAKTIVLCDAVAKDREDLAKASNDRPVLGNRHMHISRSDDR